MLDLKILKKGTHKMVKNDYLVIRISRDGYFNSINLTKNDAIKLMEKLPNLLTNLN